MIGPPRSPVISTCAKFIKLSVSITSSAHSLFILFNSVCSGSYTGAVRKVPGAQLLHPCQRSADTPGVKPASGPFPGAGWARAEGGGRADWTSLLEPAGASWRGSAFCRHVTIQETLMLSSLRQGAFYVFLPLHPPPLCGS